LYLCIIEIKIITKPYGNTVKPGFMKLITKQIENQLAKYPIYSQDSKGDEAVAVCKFFLQGYTWYVLEANKNGNDYEFFGIVDGEYKEYGYFTLSELQSLRGRWGLTVERDMYFKPTQVKDIKFMAA
jgi:hypothetical protein